MALSSLFCMGFAVYGQVLTFDLTYFDDHVWVRDLHWFLKDINNIAYIFLHQDVIISNLFYRPILTLTFFFEAQFSQMDPGVYHLSNIFIHSAGSFLVYLFFRNFHYARNLSFLCALLFLVHPVMVSAVAWIPGRTDSLLGVFVVAAFLMFDQFQRSDRLRALAGHLALWLCALLTKETAIILPVMCIWRLAMTGTLIINPGRRIVVPLIGWGLTGSLWAFLRHRAIHDAVDASPIEMIQSIWTNLPALISYLGKIFLPTNLSVLPVRQDTATIYGWSAILILIIMIRLTRYPIRWERIAWGAGWIILFILPSLVFSFVEHEYRLYLPILGAMIILLETGVIRRGFPEKNGKFLSKSFWAGLVLAGLFAGATIHRSGYYRDRMTFWRSAVTSSPHSALAQRNLGAMYFLDGDFSSANIFFEKAREINPLEPMVNNNLGLIRMNAGNAREAEAFFLEEIRINPKYDNAHYNYGLLLNKEGRNPEAIRHFEMAIRLNPNNTDAHNQIILCALQQKDFSLADHYVQKMIRERMPMDISVQQLLLENSSR